MITYQLEMIWKEPVLAKSRFYLGICLVEMRKTTKTLFRVAGVSAEVQTKHVLITG